jgi:hypothetical protein
MHHIYSLNFGGSISECYAAPTRWECEKYLRNLRRAGRMTHFYRISTLAFDRAKRKFAR